MPGVWPLTVTAVDRPLRVICCHTRAVDFDAFASLVRSRRTHMLVERDREIDRGVIEQLCELAAWAPNHKKTWPWRFASLTGDARARLGEAFAADMVDRDFGDEGKRDKTRTKYTRSPNILVVGCAADAKPTIHDENRDAVAAGVQNLLLGATALGLASFWSTAPLIDSPRALDLCGFAPDDRIVAVIYLGHPTSSVEAPARPTPPITHLT
jgi:nitroreductase